MQIFPAPVIKLNTRNNYIYDVMREGKCFKIIFIIPPKKGRAQLQLEL